MSKKDEEPLTIAALRIKGKNKRLWKELFQATLLFLAMGLFFTTCYGIDKMLDDAGLKSFGVKE